jgi:hypothetical protein
VSEDDNSEAGKDHDDHEHDDPDLDESGMILDDPGMIDDTDESDPGAGAGKSEPDGEFEKSGPDASATPEGTDGYATPAASDDPGPDETRTAGGIESVMESSESFLDTVPGGAANRDPDDVGATESPFDELASDVGESSSGDVDFDHLFEEMSTEADGIDAESVWAELGSAGVGNGETSGEEHIVPTRAFCAQCEHVADPPEVRCTYEGSEIVEFVDKDNVRVRNCPIMKRRQQVSEMD